MHYVALLRGINVGGNQMVEMKKLKRLFEDLGCTGVSTYINSGNVLFDSEDKREEIYDKIKVQFEKEFTFNIPLLVKTKEEIITIAKAVPESWKNDTEQKTDVAYLFSDLDSPETLDRLPFIREFIDVRYVKGALLWNVKRENVNNSRMTKIVGTALYKGMTVRNVNTARYLAAN